MEYYIDEAFIARILGYSRQIARTRGYVELQDGLQPSHIVAEKRYDEIKEAREAIVSGKDRLDIIAELADVARYSIILDAVAPTGKASYWYVDALSMAHTYGVDQEEVEAALEAKYALRASRPYLKDSETPEQRAQRDQEEREAIEEAINKIEWPGIPAPDLIRRYKIPRPTLYKAINSGLVPSRQADKKSAVLVNTRSPEWRKWLTEYVAKSSRRK